MILLQIKQAMVMAVVLRRVKASFPKMQFGTAKNLLYPIRNKKSQVISLAKKLIHRSLIHHVLSLQFGETPNLKILLKQIGVRV